MIHQEAVIGIILLFVAVALLVSDRVYRVEGFTNWMTGVEKGFCGVDLPPCPFGTRCVNGHCSKDEVPYLPPTSGLPVLPVGYMV